MAKIICIKTKEVLAELETVKEEYKGIGIPTDEEVRKSFEIFTMIFNGNDTA